MTDTQDLKPCECGGEAMLHCPEEFDNHAGTVMCNDCFRTLGRTDWRDAVQDWNTRPTEEALRARVEELIEALQFCERAVLLAQSLESDNPFTIERGEYLEEAKKTLLKAPTSNYLLYHILG